jgi:flagellar motility protein MotE (MotC chaperone)
MKLIFACLILCLFASVYSVARHEPACPIINVVIEKKGKELQTIRKPENDEVASDPVWRKDGQEFSCAVICVKDGQELMKLAKVPLEDINREFREPLRQTANKHCPAQLSSQCRCTKIIDFLQNELEINFSVLRKMTKEVCPKGHKETLSIHRNVEGISLSSSIASAQRLALLKFKLQNSPATTQERKVLEKRIQNLKYQLQSLSGKVTLSEQESLGSSPILGLERKHAAFEADLTDVAEMLKKYD